MHSLSNTHLYKENKMCINEELCADLKSWHAFGSSCEDKEDYEECTYEDDENIQTDTMIHNLSKLFKFDLWQLFVGTVVFLFQTFVSIFLQVLQGMKGFDHI